MQSYNKRRSRPSLVIIKKYGVKEVRHDAKEIPLLMSCRSLVRPQPLHSKITLLTSRPVSVLVQVYSHGFRAPSLSLSASRSPVRCGIRARKVRSYGGLHVYYGELGRQRLGVRIRRDLECTGRIFKSGKIFVTVLGAVVLEH